MDRSLNGQGCPCCGETKIAVVGPIPRAFQFAGAPLDAPMPPSELARCGKCGLCFRRPAPSSDELAALYQRSKNTHWDYDATVRQDWQIGRERILAHGEVGRVLDIGCWDGGFLSTLPCEKYGVEIHPEAARLAADRGICMIASTLYEIQGYDGKFDAVTAFDVAEHVHNPADLVDEMLRLAKPGGLVLVGTGDADAPSWRLMGSRYYYCTTGEHIAFISRRWCAWFARDRGVGLEGTIRFSHAPRHAASIWLKQSAANFLYRAAPWMFRRLRAAGVGKLDVSQDDARRDTPPNWMTARDHIIAVFRKPPCQ